MQRGTREHAAAANGTVGPDRRQHLNLDAHQASGAHHHDDKSATPVQAIRTVPGAAAATESSCHQFQTGSLAAQIARTGFGRESS